MKRYSVKRALAPCVIARSRKVQTTCSGAIIPSASQFMRRAARNDRSNSDSSPASTGLRCTTFFWRPSQRYPMRGLQRAQSRTQLV